jgi:hypothetical protein
MPLLWILFGFKIVVGGLITFSQEGDYSKKVLKKGREGLSFESQGVNTCSLLSSLFILTASP